jgi:DNA-binding MarR family transcriptional regulator
MSEETRTAEGDGLSGIILDVFRLGSLLMTAGDRLVAHLGLTSARWQVMDAIVASPRAQPVAWLARDMASNRQNVQRIINDLRGEGLVTFSANPHHIRAQLVVLTPKGKQIYDAATQLQTPWVNGLSQDLSLKDIQTFRRVVMALRGRLKSEGPADRVPRGVALNAGARPERAPRKR